MRQQAIRRRWTLFLLSTVALCLLATQVRLNVRADSAPRGLYLVRHQAHERGARILVCLPLALGRLGRSRGYLDPGRCPGRARPVGKRIAAVPGDLVRVGSEGLWVNGVPLSGVRRLIRDSAGRFIPAVPEGTYRVAPGTAWLVSSFHPRSWDSRYYGPVAVADDAPALVPLVLFDPLGEAAR